MSDSEKKYRGTGYGWQTDKEFERSRQTSDAARPGCAGIILLWLLFGFIAMLFTGDWVEIFEDLDSWEDYVGTFIFLPLILFWLYKESKK